MDILSLVLLILSAISFAIMLIAVVIGYLRGWKKSTFTLCRTLIAALCATVVLAIWHRVSSTGGPLTSLVYALLGKANITSLSVTELPMLKGIAASVTVPFEFSLLFVTFVLLLLIPGYFIGKHMGVYTPKAEQAPKLKTWDSLLGALANVLCVIVTLSVLYAPVTNIVHTVSEPVKKAVNIAAEVNYTEEGFDAELLRSSVEVVEKNVFYKLSTALPIRASFSIITGAKDSTFPARNEITQTLNVFADACYLMDKPENYGKKQSDALVHIADYFITSEQHAALLSTVLSAEITDDLSEKGETEAEKQFYGVLAKQLADITPKSVQEDLTTLRDIGVLCIDHGVISAAASFDEDDGGALLRAFGNEELLYGIFTSTYQNEHTRTLLGHTFALAFASLIPADSRDETAQYVYDLPTDMSDDDLRAEAKLFAQILTSDLESISDFASVESDSLKALLDLATQSKFLSTNAKTLFSAYLNTLSPDLVEASKVIQDNISGADIEDPKEACKTCYIEAIENGMEQETAKAYVETLAAFLDFDIEDAHFEEWSNEAK